MEYSSDIMDLREKLRGKQHFIGTKTIYQQRSSHKTMGHHVSRGNSSYQKDLREKLSRRSQSIKRSGGYKDLREKIKGQNLSIIKPTDQQWSGDSQSGKQQKSGESKDFQQESRESSTCQRASRKNSIGEQESEENISAGPLPNEIAKRNLRSSRESRDFQQESRETSTGQRESLEMSIDKQEIEENISGRHLPKEIAKRHLQSSRESRDCKQESGKASTGQRASRKRSIDEQESGENMIGRHIPNKITKRHLRSSRESRDLQRESRETSTGQRESLEMSIDKQEIEENISGRHLPNKITKRNLRSSRESRDFQQESRETSTGQRESLEMSIDKQEIEENISGRHLPNKITKRHLRSSRESRDLQRESRETSTGNQESLEKTIGEQEVQENISGRLLPNETAKLHMRSRSRDVQQESLETLIGHRELRKKSIGAHESGENIRVRSNRESNYFQHESRETSPGNQESLEKTIAEQEIQENISGRLLPNEIAKSHLQSSRELWDIQHESRETSTGNRELRKKSIGEQGSGHNISGRQLYSEITERDPQSSRKSLDFKQESREKPVDLRESRTKSIGEQESGRCISGRQLSNEMAERHLRSSRASMNSQQESRERATSQRESRTNWIGEQKSAGHICGRQLSNGIAERHLPSRRDSRDFQQESSEYSTSHRELSENSTSHRESRTKLICKQESREKSRGQQKSDRENYGQLVECCRKQTHVRPTCPSENLPKYSRATTSGISKQSTFKVRATAVQRFQKQIKLATNSLVESENLQHNRAERSSPSKQKQQQSEYNNVSPSTSKSMQIKAQSPKPPNTKIPSEDKSLQKQIKAEKRNGAHINQQTYFEATIPQNSGYLNEKRQEQSKFGSQPNKRVSRVGPATPSKTTIPQNSGHLNEKRQEQSNFGSQPKKRVSRVGPATPSKTSIQLKSEFLNKKRQEQSNCGTQPKMRVSQSDHATANNGFNAKTNKQQLQDDTVGRRLLEHKKSRTVPLDNVVEGGKRKYVFEDESHVGEAKIMRKKKHTNAAESGFNEKQPKQFNEDTIGRLETKRSRTATLDNVDEGGKRMSFSPDESLKHEAKQLIQRLKRKLASQTKMDARDGQQLNSTYEREYMTTEEQPMLPQKSEKRKEQSKFGTNPKIRVSHAGPATPSKGLKSQTTPIVEKPVSIQRLKIGCLNVNGLKTRLENSYFKALMDRKIFDILLVSETKLGEGDENNISMKGYRYINSPGTVQATIQTSINTNQRIIRKLRGLQEKAEKTRKYCGLGAFIREELIGSVERIEQQRSDYVLWLKISRLGCKEDIVIGAVYVPGSSSKFHTKSRVTAFKEEIEDKCSNNNSSYLFGDFNARTKELQNKKCKGFDVTRKSADRKNPNSQGKKFIELCERNNLIILNGCFGKDKDVGKETWIHRSVIDYALSSFQGFHFLEDFNIEDSDNLEISDGHALLICTLNLNKKRT